MIAPAQSKSARPWLEAALWAIGLSLFFFLVYGGCNNFSAYRDAHWHDVGTTYFAWELHIPFVPVMIVPYMSIDAFFFLAPFVCATRAELRSHARRVILAITVAGVCFLLFPLRTAYVRPDVSGIFGPAFRLFWSMDHPYNLAPSLHIGLRALIWAVYIRHTRGWLQRALKVWFVLIGASTLLIYQHHVIDIVTGYFLAGLCFAVFPTRAVDRQLVDRRAMQLAFRYATGAIALLAVAVLLRPHALILLWPVFTLLAVAAAYATGNPFVFGKRDGQLTWSSRLFFAPYLLGAQLWRWQHRRRVAPWSEITPNLFIGGALTAKQAQQLRQEGVTAVLDLTAECSETPALRQPPLHYLNIPMLDLTPPSIEQLDRATKFIRVHTAGGGRVFVHCALGLSRSACVAGACLLEFLSVDGVLDRMRTARPGVIFNTETIRRLKEFAAIQQAADLIESQSLGTRDAVVEMCTAGQPISSDSNAPSVGGAL